MKIIIAPDSFKGSLEAHHVASSLKKGLHQVDASGNIQCIPLADGGEGSLDVIQPYLSAEVQSTSIYPPDASHPDSEGLHLP